MLTIYKDLDLEIPENVTVELQSRIVKVKGPRGELVKVWGLDQMSLSLDKL